MPNRFRTTEGHVRTPGETLPLELPDGTVVTGIWGGSAQEEKLAWWLDKPGSQLAQSEPVSAIATKGEEDQLIWGEAPAGARLFFVLLAPDPGKDYRIAKMVTTPVNPAQLAYFQDDRFSLFGYFKPDGTLLEIPAPQPPPPPPKDQGELF